MRGMWLMEGGVGVMKGDDPQLLLHCGFKVYICKVVNGYQNHRVWLGQVRVQI